MRFARAADDPPAAGIDPARLDRLRRRLVEIADGSRRRMGALRAVLPGRDGPVVVAVLADRVDHHHERFTRAVAALDALADGTYARCLRCRGTIAPAHLERDPLVDLCATCARGGPIAGSRWAGCSDPARAPRSRVVA